MNLQQLRIERGKLLTAKADNIWLIKKEFDPKIDAISKQIQRLTGENANKMTKAQMRAAKNMR